MNTLRVGIASAKEMKERSIAIACGELLASPGDPKVWFTSLESFAKILSNKNRALLEFIAASNPESLQELAAGTGRKVSNLSRTLKKMARYGFVRLHRDPSGEVRPEVTYREITLVISLATE